MKGTVGGEIKEGSLVYLPAYDAFMIVRVAEYGQSRPMLEGDVTKFEGGFKKGFKRHDIDQWKHYLWMHAHHPVEGAKTVLEQEQKIRYKNKIYRIVNICHTGVQCRLVDAEKGEPMISVPYTHIFHE